MNDAVVPKITRWSPDTCDCVIEIVAHFDTVLVPGMIIKEPEFLMMNEVCDDHDHMKSMAFRDNHSQLSSNVLQIVAKAKKDNLKQVDDLIDKAQNLTKRKARTLRELSASRDFVLRFNSELDEEWNELVSFPHEF